jgi:uroporphyrinogen decarboxylase
MSGPVLLVRAAGGDDRDAEALAALGVEVIEDPYLVVAPCEDPGAVGRPTAVLDALRTDVDVLLLTSRAAVRALDALVGRDALQAAVAAGVARGLWGAAVGPVTADALRELGVADVLEPEVATSRGLLAALRGRTAAANALPDAADGAAEDGAAHRGLRAVLPCGARAMKGLGAGLTDDGWRVDEVVVYTTEEVAAAPASVADLRAGHIAAVVLRSPTAVRALARHVPELPDAVVTICGGPTTLAAAEAAWGGGCVVSDAPTAEAVARTVAAVLAARAAGSADASGAEPS